MAMNSNHLIEKRFDRQGVLPDQQIAKMRADYVSLINVDRAKQTGGA